MHCRKYIFLVCFLLLSVGSFAQQDSLPVKIIMDNSAATDSLWFTVSVNKYTRTSSLMFTASLENTTIKDTFYIPVIDTVSRYCFVFPNSIQQNLSLQAYFYPGIFRISGTLNNQRKATPIKAILITDNYRIFNKEISFNGDNKFSLPGLVFEKEASVAFNYADDNKWKKHPDVSISVTPAASDFNQLLFSTKIKRLPEQTNEQPNQNKNLKDSLEKGTTADNKFKTLKDVEIAATKKSKIQKFNEEYSSGLFKDISEKVFDCIDNSDILGFPDCISYLQGKVAGLTIGYNEGEMTVKWRGKQMQAFYIDEIAVDIDQVIGISPAEIAMMKVYEPPFFGSSKGSGGAIAIYTRRGEYVKQDATKSTWLFKVQGYTPPISVLFENESTKTQKN